MAIAMYNGNEPYIFISYAHTNSDVVLPIIEALANNGFRVWYDAGIEAGTEWPEYVAEKLLGSSVVIAFISEAALKSQNCRREINFAISERKDVLSIYTENVTLTPGMKMILGLTQAMFYNRLPYGVFLQELMDATILASCRSVNGTNLESSALIDFWTENGVLKKYVGKSSSVVVPGYVTNIGHEVFSGCMKLVDITIPDGVTDIGYEVFCGCANLMNITIPESVTSIGHGAFKGCGRLESITIPSGVRKISSGTFYRCASLTAVTIPNGVKSIGTVAFWGCTNLSDITIPSSVTSMDARVFKGCTNLTIYCQSESKPVGWADDWNPDNRPVVWGWKE